MRKRDVTCIARNIDVAVEATAARAQAEGLNRLVPLSPGNGLI